MKIGKLKKLTTIFLAFVMVFGLIYSNNVVKADTTDDNGIVLNKTAEYDSVKDQVKITLESYATGRVTTGERTPSDIVLLLDVSGSMVNSFNDESYREKVFDENYTISSLYSSSNNYYYFKDGVYYEVQIKRESYGYIWNPKYVYSIYYITGRNNSHLIVGELTGDKLVKNLNFSLYQKVSKIDALKDAANSFIDGINDLNKDVTDDSKRDRISIVKFADDDYGNDNKIEYTDDGNRYNLTQIVKTLTTINSNTSSELQNLVNSLEASGATAADYGLNSANNALNKADDPLRDMDRNKVVILFTDGEPNHSRGFSDSVAKAAVDTAKQMKDKGTTIYTIGVFEDANPSDISKDFNKYMHGVSSNYLEISYDPWNPWGDKTFGNMVLGKRNPDRNDYYLKAENNEELLEAFKQILESVGESSTDLDENSVLIDYVENTFSMPSESDVKVYTVDYDSENKKFDETTKTLIENPGLSIEGDAIKVSGFDYSEHYVLKDNPNKDHVGQKLVVEFDVTPVDGFIGGNNIETNKSLSGIYQNNQSKEPIEEFINPNVDIDLKYDIKNKDATIYRGNNWDQFIHFITNESNNNIVYSNDRNSQTEMREYVLDGIRNKYVDIEYTIKNADETTIATLTIPAGKTIEDCVANIIQNPTKDLEECTDFNVNVSVTPSIEKQNGVAPINKIADEVSTLHILQPIINVNDSIIDYGTQTDLDSNVNYDSQADWTDVGEHTGIPAVEGDKPNLVYSYEKVDSSTEKLEEDKYIPMVAEDADFRLIVTNQSTGATYNDCVKNGNEITNIFNVDVRTARLDINKVLQDNQYESNDGEPIFIYKVTVTNQYLGTKVYYRYIHYKLSDISAYNLLDDDLSILEGLPVGEYTIEELDTLRFEAVKAKVEMGTVKDEVNSPKDMIKFKINQLENNLNFVVKFTNKTKSKDYDSDNDIVVNEFSKTADNGVSIVKRLNGSNN